MSLFFNNFNNIIDSPIRIITYNILSESFEDYNDYCPDNLRKWNIRFKKIQNQLLNWDGDILSFQELNHQALVSDFIPLLSKEYKNFSNCSHHKGLGIFYKKHLFTLINSKGIVFNDYWDNFCEKYELSNRKANKLDTYMNVRDDMALFTYFKHKQTKKEFIFVTTHLFHNPRFPDVKSSQIAILLDQLEEFINDNKLSLDIPVIITGDLNSLDIKYKTDEFDIVKDSKKGLISGVYELLDEGILKQSHPQHPNGRAQYNKDKIISNTTIQTNLFKDFTHPFSLNSAYKIYNGNEPKLTTKTSNFQGTLDYIWISDKLTVSKVLDIPQNTSPIPNDIHPSDHFPLYADINF